MLAKLFSEAVESIDPGPVEGVRATGATPLQEIVWGVIPQVAPLWTSYALYRFESNARSATVLGLIGAGGIGQLLFESLNAFDYHQPLGHRDRDHRRGDPDRPAVPGDAQPAAVGRLPPGECAKRRGGSTRAKRQANRETPSACGEP